MSASPISLPSFSYGHTMDKEGNIAWLKTFHLSPGEAEAEWLKVQAPHRLHSETLSPKKE